MIECVLTSIDASFGNVATREKFGVSWVRSMTSRFSGFSRFTSVKSEAFLSTDRRLAIAVGFFWLRGTERVCQTYLNHKAEKILETFCTCFLEIFLTFGGG